MANEITRTVNLSISNDPESASMSAGGQYSQSVKGIHVDEVAVPITAAGTAITNGPIAAGSEGVCEMQNLDQTNYVEVGRQVAGTFYPVIQLKPGTGNKPGPPIQFDWPTGSVALYWRSHTAVCNVRKLIGNV